MRYFSSKYFLKNDLFSRTCSCQNNQRDSRDTKNFTPTNMTNC